MMIPPNDPDENARHTGEIPDSVDYQAVIDILRKTYPDMHIDEIVAHVARILKERGA